MTKNGIMSFDIQDQFGILSIDNGSQNKIDNANFIDLEVLKKWIKDNNFKGLIITGKGRHFSAGANFDNIVSLKNNIDELKSALEKGHEILSFIEQLDIPTVAAISGICFGGGLEIALSCHFRVCGENGILAFPESTIGIMPGLGGTVKLPKIVGRSKALEIILSGGSINADEAKGIGLVDILCEKKKELEVSVDFLKKLTENKPIEIINSIIKSINHSMTNDLSSSLKYELDLFSKRVEKL